MRDLMSYLPEWYQNSRETVAIQESIQPEIDLIQQANPNAVIYLESLIPLTAEKSAKSDWLNNDHVNSFNKMIWQLAADKGVYYLNTAAGLAGEDGTLPGDASTDGVHLNKEACGKWLEYLKTHTAGAGS